MVERVGLAGASPAASLRERLRNASPDARTVEHLLGLALSEPAAGIVPGLVGYGRGLLDAGYPDERLHADRMCAYKRVSELGEEDLEDAVLDAIDSLMGWCPPGAALCGQRERSY